jgi:uncharacterized protein YndB with AHSA1/START domain
LTLGVSSEEGNRMALFTPDLSDRPFGGQVVRDMGAGPDAIYKCFTTGWDTWFAVPGALIATPVPQGHLFFLVEHQGARHPHYGRFLMLEPNRAVELTWLTGEPGTRGAETVLTVDIATRDRGCRLTLDHRGFYEQDAADRHRISWYQILCDLDKRLTA